jgi:hypothetical protein
MSCVQPTSSEGGSAFSIQAARQIHAGVTDKAAALKLLGSPPNRYASGNSETWTFTHSTGTTPGYGFGNVGTQILNVATQSETLIVQFTNGVVSSCALSLSSGTIGASTSQTTDCDKQ